MTQLQKKYKDLLIIAVNDWGESTERVAEFAKKTKLDHLILIGGKPVSESKYGVTSSPTGFLIDHTGKIVRREKGFHPTLMPALEKKLVQLLEVAKAAKP